MRPHLELTDDESVYSGDGSSLHEEGDQQSQQDTDSLIDRFAELDALISYVNEDRLAVANFPQRRNAFFRSSGIFSLPAVNQAPAVAPLRADPYCQEACAHSESAKLLPHTFIVINITPNRPVLPYAAVGIAQSLATTQLKSTYVGKPGPERHPDNVVGGVR
jgi:hypothetical protein